MKFKLIATDVDGTFIPHEGKVVLSAIKAHDQAVKKGILTSICSGRGLVGIGPIQKLAKFDYLVGGNGSLVYDLRNNSIIFKKEISGSVIKRLTEFLNKQNAFWALESIEEVVFHDTDYNRSHPYAVNAGYPIEFVSDYAKDTLKVMVLGHKDMISLEKEIESMFPGEFNIFRLELTIEIVAKGVDKFKGLEKLQNHLNIHNNETVVLGDSGNDIELLRHSENSIAMGNAPDWVKKHAKHTTDHVLEHGWSNALIKLGVIDE